MFIVATNSAIGPSSPICRIVPKLRSGAERKIRGCIEEENLEKKGTFGEFGQAMNKNRNDFGRCLD